MLFTKEDVEEALRLLVDELVVAGANSTIYVVGGAAIALRVEREVLTTDIDALFPPTADIRAAVARVAAAKQWPSTWLNDEVKMWASHFDTDGDWEIRLARERVSIRIAEPPLLLAMKLLAGRGLRDAWDIDLLLEACAVTSFNAATAVFEKYYPTEAMSPRALSQLRERFASSA